MAIAEDWIAARIVEARGLAPLLTDPVCSQADGLLTGQLAERPLSSTELAKVAKSLIAAMEPAEPRAEVRP